MQVSFVIPLFNCLPLTQAMLASLRATLPPELAHEIIFVDDGSTDGTRAWLASLAHEPSIRVVLNERNLGYAAANNRAVALATGEFLALLNNDLVLSPRWLEPLLRVHRSLGARAGLIGNVQRDARTGEVDHVGVTINLKAKPEHLRTRPHPLLRPFISRREVPAVTGACLLLRRALWTQLGGFDEHYLNGGEDIDLCFRARALGLVNAVALRSVIRHHISSSLNRKLRDEENNRRLALRWRRELITLAARTWCHDHVASIAPRSVGFDPSLARRAWFHALGLTRLAPPEALAAAETAMNIELARWQSLL